MVLQGEGTSSAIGKFGPSQCDVMAPGADKSRLTIGFYQTGEHLCSTVGRLVDLGLDRHQLGIVRHKTALPALVLPPFDDERLALVRRLLDEVEPLETPGATDLVASRGPLRSLLQSGAWSEGAASGGSAGLTIASNLGAEIRNGATALAVVSATADQQWASARLLLQNSVLPVLTHEFRASGKRR